MPNIIRLHTQLLCGLATLLITASDATAQPNPFDDYEGGRSGPVNTAPAAANDGVGAQNTDGPLALPVAELTRKGHLRLGANGAFSYNSTNNEVGGGAEVANSTLFLLLAAQGGYFILDNLEVGAQLGYMSRQFARGPDETATSDELLVIGQARYHLALSDRFSLMPGLGLGFYVGSSDRQITLVLADSGTRKLNEQTDTFGGAFIGSFELGYMLTEQVQLQLGINLVGLVGAESSETQPDSLFGTSFNTGLGAGLSYLF